jgi:hypothetical protein
MANENLEGQTSDLENTESQDASAQNPDEGQSAVSPAAQSDTDKRLAALEAQVAREKERNQFLEQSLKIQERFLQTRSEGAPATSAAKPAGDQWSPELDTLDKALDPLFQKKLKSATDPLVQGYTTMIEDNDALRFEMFLGRNHPELLDDEDAYNQTMQQVEQVRQAARQRGITISRVDAFVFNEGLQGTRQKVAQRKQKKTVAATAESRRVAETKVAEGTGGTGAPRASAASNMKAIRDKARSGERLTPEERTQYRNWVSNVEL